MPFLRGVRVLDFTTLLPGPLATLVLAEAGADVVKVERPGGDPMRVEPPLLAGESVPFAMLNRGKRSVEVDLKASGGPARLTPLLESADVLVEQFRPGVMERLGLGWETVRARNPRLVYCSISGYGQTGPRAAAAGHDLNYVAGAGMLALTADAAGAPLMPHVQIADIGAGSYPAVINILLALLRARATGEGACLDVAMTEQVLPFLWQALAAAWAGAAPAPNRLPLAGGSPRYGLYPTADGGALAVGALEDRFWANFCDLVGLDPALRDDSADPSATAEGVRRAVAARPSSHWRARTEGASDLCCTLVPSLAEALADPQFEARGVFAGRVAVGGGELPAVPAPLAPALRGGAGTRRAPRLGEANPMLLEAA